MSKQTSEGADEQMPDGPVSEFSQPFIQCAMVFVSFLSRELARFVMKMENGIEILLMETKENGLNQDAAFLSSDLR